MLIKRGWHVELLECRGDPRAAGYQGGRSINLALSYRGIVALQQAGLDNAVLAEAIPMRARCIHNAKGQTTQQAYSRHADRYINSVSRGGLNCQLLSAADRAGAAMHFDVSIDAIDVQNAAVTLADGHCIEADLLIGADGGGSQVRQAMVDAGHCTVTQDMLGHGYKELTIPAGPNGTWLLEREVLHIWPHGASMMIALPNPDGSFTCTVFWPHTGHGVSFEHATADTIRQLYPDAAAHMSTLNDDWAANPIGTLGTIRCDAWSANERAMLIGDAAHAIVPFYGQGMNAGFEDVAWLGASLDRGDALATFAATRKPQADAIANLALHNFIEMRDHTASLRHAAKHALGQGLDRLFPGLLTPLYELVTFTDVPYERCVRIGERRRFMLRALFLVCVLVVLFGLLWILQ
jgi:kynurenine 3-monooxygenase